MKKLQFVLSGILSIVMLVVSAQQDIRLTKVAGGLSKPLFVTHVNDDRIFIVEQAGKVKILKNGIVSADPFLNITDRVNSRNTEQGLLGLAFHPDFKNNGFIYVNYIANGVNRTVVSRFNLVAGNPDRIDSSSEKVLMIINQPFSNHNGGCIHFGRDGYLYIAQGDGGSARDPMGNGQNRKTMLAKMLRIDVNSTGIYGIPPDNPFAKDTSYLPEIWALGLRNPWRWSFDRLNGDMWIADVGQDIWEEVNYTSASSKGGENYGWRCYEGLADFDLSGCQAKSNFVFPIANYKHNTNAEGCSITGGYVYRGSECSYLYGDYIYGDYCSGWIWAIHKYAGVKDSFANRLIYKFSKNQLSSFGEDAQGELYLCALAEGSVYKLSDTCRVDVSITSEDPDCDDLANGWILLGSNQKNCNYEYRWDNGISGMGLSGLPGGTFTVTISYPGCEVKKEINLKPKLRKDTACLTPLFVSEICDGDSALIIACEKSGKRIKWYNNGIEETSLQGARIFVSKSGLYSIRWEDTTYKGCISYPSVAEKITVHPLPPTPMLMVSGDTLKTGNGWTSYVWYKDGKVAAGSTTPYFVAKNSGFYQVQVIDSNNCRSILSDSLLFIPTKVSDANIASVRISPNPGNGQFIFELDHNPFRHAQWTVMNADGSELLHQCIEPGDRSSLIDLTVYPPGIYFYYLAETAGGHNLLHGKLFVIR